MAAGSTPSAASAARRAAKAGPGVGAGAGEGVAEEGSERGEVGRPAEVLPGGAGLGGELDHVGAGRGGRGGAGRSERKAGEGVARLGGARLDGALEEHRGEVGMVDDAHRSAFAVMVGCRRGRRSGGHPTVPRLSPAVDLGQGDADAAAPGYSSGP
jgi:hypothetical protein